jgi:type II secretory pathway predicted ATPase ExeA
MFDDFFGMVNTPFLNSVPVESLYISERHKEILGRLGFAAQENRFAVITGGVGNGKSTLVRKFVNSLNHEQYTTLYLSDSQLTPRWFYKGFLDQLGIEAKFYRGDAKRQLHKQLQIIREVHHKKVVAIVDEAHLLERETLEEIRFVLNFKMDSMNPMSLILVGQTELWDKLHLQAYAAIKQRIDIKSELPAMDRAETGAYIASHLAYAGGQTEIFTDSAIDELFRFSVGAPRAINKAATHCLINADQSAKKLIDDAMVKRVIEAELP